MTTIVQSEWGRRLRGVGSTVVGLAVITYLMAKGISILAAAIAPGVWGYFGAVGFLALVGALPLPLLMGVRLGGRRTGLITLGAAIAIAATCLGSARHWPGWVPVVVLAAMPIAYLALRAIRSLPVRLTHRRAVKLLRRQRGNNAWSLSDWEWAYTQLGTPTALGQAAWCRMLGAGTPRHPDEAAT